MVSIKLSVCYTSDKDWRLSQELPKNCMAFWSHKGDYDHVMNNCVNDYDMFYEEAYAEFYDDEETDMFLEHECHGECHVYDIDDTDHKYPDEHLHKRFPFCQYTQLYLPDPLLIDEITFMFQALIIRYRAGDRDEGSVDTLSVEINL